MKWYSTKDRIPNVDIPIIGKKRDSYGDFFQFICVFDGIGYKTFRGEVIDPTYWRNVNWDQSHDAKDI